MTIRVDRGFKQIELDIQLAVKELMAPYREAGNIRRLCDQIGIDTSTFYAIYNSKQTAWRPMTLHKVLRHFGFGFYYCESEEIANPKPIALTDYISFRVLYDDYNLKDGSFWILSAENSAT